MADSRAPRRLAAILAADVVGYSRLMENDEKGTLAALKARRKEVLQPTVSEHVDGKAVLRPNVPVMEPEDVVEASLAGLALGDVICSPALADRGLLNHERQARHAVFGGGRGAELSPRYRKGL
ncbi:hypothetical protein NKI38_19495 [Mesorhizobium sp. M0621]|uniref:hypothetical protein n=1 Tax=Mesorhizobium sp. M0621 TaxID=2956974 RepID=UPI00333AB2DE